MKTSSRTTQVHVRRKPVQLTLLSPFTLAFSFLSATFDRIAEINFNLEADDNSVSVTALKRIRGLRIHSSFQKHRFEFSQAQSRVCVCVVIPPLQANAAAFEACCKERIQQFDDAEEEEDIWEEKEMNYATQSKSRTR